PRPQLSWLSAPAAEHRHPPRRSLKAAPIQAWRDLHRRSLSATAAVAQKEQPEPVSVARHPIVPLSSPPLATPAPQPGARLVELSPPRYRRACRCCRRSECQSTIAP